MERSNSAARDGGGPAVSGAYALGDVRIEVDRRVTFGEQSPLVLAAADGYWQEPGPTTACASTETHSCSINTGFIATVQGV